jgi:energy-coupling factor transporter transmembrane protein EcfT
MDLHYIDYISVSGRSWLHKAPAWIKMLALVAIIAVLLAFESIPIEAGIALSILAMAVSARIPMRLYLPLMLYPVVFLVILFLSIEGLTWHATGIIGLRVLALTGTVVLFLMTTSYPRIFGTLSRILPSFLVAALFFTYRSIFLIADSIVNIRIAMHLRGGIDWRRPVASLRSFGMALGHVMVHSIDMSQRMADGLAVRGFANRIYYLDGGK